MQHIKHIIFILVLSLLCGNISAKKTESNQEEARRLFEKSYNLVFGKEGSSLTYKVNIVGLYKTEGHITYKGKKHCFEDAQGQAWCDGTTIYKVSKKDKAINIYRVNDEKSDRYMSKFKFDGNNFTYSYKAKGNTYEITAKVKNSSLMGIKHITLVVMKNNLYPISLRLKVGFMSTTVQISNFKAGNINDNIFLFPRTRFYGYTVHDHRNE